MLAVVLDGTSKETHRLRVPFDKRLVCSLSVAIFCALSKDAFLDTVTSKGWAPTESVKVPELLSFRSAPGFLPNFM